MGKSISDVTTLNNGVKMPYLGFGVYLMEDGKEVENSIRKAIEVGYRSIDTASFYKNESGVGRAINESNVPRDEIFVTTKVWNEDLRQRRVKAAFDESLSLLNMDYVDLYLIHWPVKGCYLDAWKEVEEIYQSGRAKAIGVSNFTIGQLEEVLADCEVKPTVNQIEFHPYLVQPELLEFCKENDIQPEAWSPLMQGQIIDVPSIKDLAEKHGRSAAQIVLRWNLQKGVVTIPKSSKAHRIEENSQLFDFQLSAEEVSLIDSLDKGQRVGPDPNDFDF